MSRNLGSEVRHSFGSDVSLRCRSIPESSVGRSRRSVYSYVRNIISSKVGGQKLRKLTLRSVVLRPCLAKVSRDRSKDWVP